MEKVRVVMLKNNVSNSTIDARRQIEFSPNLTAVTLTDPILSEQKRQCSAYL